MLSYVHGHGSVALLGETIGASLNRAAAQFGDRDALIQKFRMREISISELGLSQADAVQTA